MAIPLLLPLMGGLSALAAKARATFIIAGVISGMTWMLKSKLGFFVMSALLWLGLNIGTMGLLVTPALDAMYALVQNGPSTGEGGQYLAVAFQWMGVMNMDRAVTMIGSAVGARWAMTMGKTHLFALGHGKPVAGLRSAG